VADLARLLRLRALPRGPKLLPYTTLFRSERALRDDADVEPRVDARGELLLGELRAVPVDGVEEREVAFVPVRARRVVVVLVHEAERDAARLSLGAAVDAEVHARLEARHVP